MFSTMQEAFVVIYRQRARKMKVYLIAGEPSGDKLGAELMAGLSRCTSHKLEFFGVGGPLMEEQGLASLFPISDIAVMCIGEILAKRAKEKKIDKVYFDRGGYKYHGRVKLFAETLRKNGLKF